MLLSICIPTYNRPERLLDCLNSIAAQKNKNNFEVCISDNCSKFKIKSLIRPFKKKLILGFKETKKI